MKMMRTSLMALCATVSLGAGAATVRYDVKDLGTRPDRAALPASINAAGQVAGQALDPVTGDIGSFATGPQGEGMNDPCPAGTLSCTAVGIDDAGHVAIFMLKAVGQGNFTLTSALANIDGSGLRTLGNLGIKLNQVGGLSHQGVLTGQSVSADGLNEAYVGREPGKRLRGLGTGTAVSSLGRAVNDSGHVVGTLYPDNFSQHVLLAGPGADSLQDLGTLGGSYGTAVGISNNGHIVGYSYVDAANSESHAFLARVGTPGLVDLGTLGGTYSAAHAVNSDGVIVGASTLPNGDTVAFVKRGENGLMTDLNTLVSMPAGVTLWEGDAINEAGQIAAYGSDLHAWLLTPRR